jgi:hypothetical protein
MIPSAASGRRRRPERSRRAQWPLLPRLLLLLLLGRRRRQVLQFRRVQLRVVVDPGRFARGPSAAARFKRPLLAIDHGRAQTIHSRSALAVGSRQELVLPLGRPQVE